MAVENNDNFKEIKILREYCAELDDNAIEVLRQYFKIEESDNDKIMKFVRFNRSPTDDLLEARVD